MAQQMYLSVIEGSFRYLDVAPLVKGMLQGQVVLLNTDFSDNVRTTTLLHEMAHHCLDHVGRRTAYFPGEVEAEATCFITGYLMGMGDMRYSAPYLAWYTGGNIEKLRRKQRRVEWASNMILWMIQENSTKK